MLERWNAGTNALPRHALPRDDALYNGPRKLDRKKGGNKAGPRT